MFLARFRSVHWSRCFWSEMTSLYSTTRKVLEVLLALMVDAVVLVALSGISAAVLIGGLVAVVYLFVGDIPQAQLIVDTWFVSLVCTFLSGLVGRARWLSALMRGANEEFGISRHDLLTMKYKGQRALFKEIKARREAGKASL